MKPDTEDSLTAREQVFKTEEGPVFIARTGKQVFVSESFDLPLARNLQALLENAQSTGEQVDVMAHPPSLRGHELVSPWEAGSRTLA